MRKIGEVRIGAIPNQHRTREQMNRNKENGKADVAVTCPDCEKSFNVSVNKIRAWGDNIKCYDCHHKGKDEMNQAVIALARRKGLIK
jgi:predicted Zn finger-like uncharacterized protein